MKDGNQSKPLFSTEELQRIADDPMAHPKTRALALAELEIRKEEAGKGPA
jgi:hypothetical protein